MSTLAPTPVSALPAGVWTADPLHSSVTFSVRHMVSTFRGELSEFTGALTVADGRATLEASGPAASIRTQDPNLNAHLLSPEFFDVERTPEVSLRSSAVTQEGDDVVIEAELTMKGITRPVVLRGTLTGPAEDPFGGRRAGLAVETVVDRRDFGLDWNMPLPGGGFILGHDVTVSAEVELILEAGQ